MKRKLLNGLLALAMIVAGASVFSSCKDTNEDLISQTKSDLMSELLDKEKTLRDLISALEEAQRQCAQTCAENLRNEINRITTELNAAIDKKADQSYVDSLKQELQNALTRLSIVEGRLDVAEGKINQNKNEIDALRRLLENLGVTGSTGGITITNPSTGETTDIKLQDVIDMLNLNIYNLQQSLTTLQQTMNTEISNINNTISGLQTQLSDLDKKLTEGYVTKEEYEREKAALNQAISNLSQSVNDLNTAITNTNQRITDLETSINNSIDALKPDIKKGVDAYNWIQENQARINALESGLAQLRTYVDTNFATKTELSNAISTLETKLQNQIETIKTNLSNLETKLTQEVQRIDGTISNLKTLFEGKISQLNTLIEALSGRVTLTEGAIQQLGIDLNALKTKVGENASAIALNKAAIEALTARVAANEANISTNTAAIAALTTRVESLESEISAIKTQIETLFNELSRINERLNKLVTGIILQGTVNPVFGSFSLPINVQSNVLITYFGESQTKVVFPSSSSAAEYNNELWLTGADMNILKAGANFAQINNIQPGSILLNENEGNAGKVYVTINPNTVDFTGVSLPIVNSRDEESGIKLSPLAKSDELLNFGYSRADNGFYEANATLAPEDIASVKVEIESSLKPAMKQALKDLKDRKFAIGTFIDLGQAIYNQFNGILPAYAMKAAWTAPDINGIDVNHAVYSQYNLAATAFKPLSFKFLYDSSFPKVPTFNPINEIDPDKFNLQVELKKYISLDGKEVPDIKISPDDFKFDFNLDGITLTVKIPKVVVTRDPVTGAILDVQIIENGDVVTVEGSDLQELEKALNNQLNAQLFGKAFNASFDGVSLVDALNKELKNSVHTMLSDIQKSIDDLAGRIDEKLDDIIGTVNDKIAYANKFINIYNQVANRLNNILDNPNHYLQPMMVYKGGDNAYHQLSQQPSMPTTLVRAGGNVVSLLPTTYTAEIAAPVYKKFIGVTNVWKADNMAINAQAGDSYCANLAKKANSQGYLDMPLMGNTHRVLLQVDNSSVGYTYEIVYSALDYSGVTSTRKYYVTVK